MIFGGPSSARPQKIKMGDSWNSSLRDIYFLNPAGTGANILNDIPSELELAV